LSLDLIEGGTGMLLTDPWQVPAEPPETGIADVEPGDVLFGKLRPYLAKVVHASRPAYASTELMCLRPRPGIDSRWFFYRMMARPTVEWSVTTSEGTKMPRTNWERFREFRVTVPPLTRQRAIADYLDTETARIDALIAKKVALDVQLSQKLFSATEAAVVRLLGSSRLVPFKYVVREIDERGRHSRAGELLSVSIHHGVVPRSKVTEDEPRRDDLASYKKCRPGDLVINRMRAFHGGLGCAQRSGLISPDYMVLRPAGAIEPRYLHHLCRSPWFVGQMTSRLRGIGAVDQGNVRTPRINFADLGNVHVPAPPSDLQQDLVARLDRTSAAIASTRASLERQLGLLREHRQALITAAVTGELDVPARSA